VYRDAVARDSKVYDQAYFDRWYRDPRYALFHHGMLPRRVQLAVAASEYLLERPIKSVLDVGCGEGRWRPLLKQVRPRVRYVGVDSSAYVVARYGKRRQLRLGRLGQLGQLGLEGRFDLIVCSDVLHYVERDELSQGLRAIARLLEGVAFLELYSSEDTTEGDDLDFQRRSGAVYRRLFKQAGLIPLGLHCYAGRALRDRLATFERGSS
jgi:SAM-dependent methyltransferase